MSIVPVKLDRDEVRRLDMLVRLGIFKNRSQAIRSMLREGLEKKFAAIPLTDLSGIEPIVDLMMRPASKGIDVIRIRSPKSAGQIVAEGRQCL